MTTLADYLSLLPSEHAEQPNFNAVLAAALQPVVDATNCILNTPAAYDIDRARGVQLDVIGAWLGASRRVVVPLNDVYFSWDILGVGFDEGVWYQTNDPTIGMSMLDDETYRMMLKMKALANKWDGTLSGAQTVLQVLAGYGLNVFVQDNFNMTFTIRVYGSTPSALLLNVIKLATEWIRPAGVGLAQITVM